ncbi:NUDIX hydrolase [Patescibacteria group bacterium]|nr:NUDIX hydrolase [Patescibacteria group bacterium]
MENHKLFKVNQNAIISNKNNEILILQKDGKWLLPGGRIEESDKTWEQALRREIKEETGINDFKIERISEVGMSDSGNTYIIVFICKIESIPEIKLSHEHQKYEWVSLKDIDNYEFWHKDIKERIKK